MSMHAIIFLLSLLLAAGNAAQAQQLGMVIPCDCGRSGYVDALFYYSRGVSFLSEESSGKVVAVQVFPGRSPASNQGLKDQTLVVPGTGAFGVKLGDTLDRVREIASDHYIGGSPASADEPHRYEALGFKDGRMLYASVYRGRVSQIVASGSFRTPEGVTQESSANEIMAAYGQPDVVWGFPAVSGTRASDSRAGKAPLVALACAGGLFLVWIIWRVRTGRRAEAADSAVCRCIGE